MKGHRINNYLLPAIAFFNSFASIEVSIGGLLLVRSASDSLLINGAVSSISSIGLIICTLFIGAKLDNINKRSSLILFNGLMFIALLIPFFSANKYFFMLFICSDVFVSLFSLIESLSFSGSIKQLISEEYLEKIVNWNSACSMIGIVLSICTISMVTLITKSFKAYFPIAGVAYLVNCLLSTALIQRRGTLENSVHFSTLDHLKKVAISIKNNNGLRKSIFLSIVFTLVQSVFNSLLIYYWKEVDSTYSKIIFLIISYGIGIALGIWLIRFERNKNLMFTLVFILAFTFLIMDLNPSVYVMCISIVIVMVVTIPMTNIARKVRIKNTGIEVQSSQESFVQFGNSVLEILFNTVFAGFAQILGNTGLVLVMVGLFALLVMISCERGVYVYDRERSN